MKKNLLLVISAIATAAVISGCANAQGGSSAAVEPQNQTAGQDSAPDQAVQEEASGQPQTDTAAVTPKNNSAGGDQTVQTGQTAKQNTKNPAAQTGTGNAITEEQAKEIALNHAQIAAADAVFVKVKLDYDDGVQNYEVEFYVQNKEYDYEINAQTGEIMSTDYDIESQVPVIQNGQSNTASAGNQSGISLEEAKKIALSQVQGATETDLRIEQDMDDGQWKYEGKIIYKEMEYEFEIDAATGNLTEWSAESIYD